MILGGIQRCSTIDFPGYLSCVLFVCGCDLDCFYCHNRALLDGSSPVISVDEALSFLRKRQGLLEGVVISGGEPALYEDLPAFIKTIRSMGYRIKLDTNGQHCEMIKALIKDCLLDYVAIDMKALRDDYSWVCASSEGFEKAKQTIELLLHSGISFEARTTLYPGLTQSALVELLQALPVLPRYRLNLFRMPEKYLIEHSLLLRRPALTLQDLTRLSDKLKEMQPNIIW